MLGSDLGIKALAFEPCKGVDFNFVQVEAIMLALRALYSDDINKLKAVFAKFSKKGLTLKQSAITDIGEFIVSVSFGLPSAKMEDIERRRLDNHIAEDIKQAA